MPLGELCVLGQAVSDEIARQRAMPPLPPGCLAADGERDTVVVPGASPGGSIYVSLAWTCG